MSKGNSQFAASQIVPLEMVDTHQPEMFPAEGSVLSAIDAAVGVPEQYHRRHWVLERATKRDGKVFGRFGHMKVVETNENFVNGRFVEFPVSLGASTPFVFDVESSVIVFQVKGTISEPAFRNALERLLRTHSERRWAVVPFSSGESYQQFVRSLHVVTEFKAVLHRPNPDYTDRPTIEERMTSAHAEIMQLSYKTSTSSLNLDDPAVVEAVRHARAQKKSYVKVKGKSKRGNLRDWQSNKQGKPKKVSRPAVTPESAGAALESVLDEVKEGELPVDTSNRVKGDEGS